MMAAPFGPVVEVADVMAGFRRPWFISGGWAIDLFVGRETRSHHDLEIGLFFPDQHAIRRHLADWTSFGLIDQTWKELPDDTDLELPEFQLQVRHPSLRPTEFDLFLNPRDGTDWVSRRHE